MDPLERYAAVEHLRDGRRLTIRALRKEDRDGLLAAADCLSDETLYRRFFAPKHGFSASEIDAFVTVDFHDCVALVALASEGRAERVVGGARSIATGPGEAEIALTVIDAYQGQGVGTALLRHLIAIARSQGLAALRAEVLADNAPMLSLLAGCGLRVERRREGGVVHAVAHLESPDPEVPRPDAAPAPPDRP